MGKFTVCNPCDYMRMDLGRKCTGDKLRCFKSKPPKLIRFVPRGKEFPQVVTPGWCPINEVMED